MSLRITSCIFAIAIALVALPASSAVAASTANSQSANSLHATDKKKVEEKKSDDKTPASKPKEGLFFINGGIDDDSAKEFVQSLEKWTNDANHDGQPVRIVMNSPGGIVVHGFAIIDEINAVRRQGHHVTVVVYGEAASAAGWVLQSADTRVIGANSWVLIHQISSTEEGKLVELQRGMQFTTQLQDQFLQMLATRSHLTLQEIHSHIDNGQDWWIPADEALKLRLVDQVEQVPAYK